MHELISWASIPENSDFSIYNLPWGIFSTRGSEPRIGVAIGDHILDMPIVASTGILDEFSIPDSIWMKPTLNDFIKLGKNVTSSVRTRLQQELCAPESSLRKMREVFVNMENANMHLPVFVRDYTDFYSSIEHATNVGKMFRDPENALLPNWKHLPVGYHGRASSIVVSGTPVKRPNGQTKPGDGSPVYGPSKALDFELEMAFIVGQENMLGDPISIHHAEEYIFGMVLFNDWSARDIQKWEYVPLGPFLGKSFASSVSPWIVTMEALEPYRVASPVQDPKPLPYLKHSGFNNFDIYLEVSITPAGGDEKRVTRSNFKYMYWSMVQQLAHHTVNGCNVSIGDMMASGTISGSEPDSYGSMLELSWGGKKPITMPDGSQRSFLLNGDTVTMRGYAGRENRKVGFGTVTGQII